MTIMTNQQGEPEALRPIARYKIGYATDDWGVRSSTPGGIPDPAGAWVRYKDHVAALVEAQQPAPSAAADLIAALEEARSAINSMKVEAETAGQGDEQMMLEACETISNEGLQADMAIRAALASAPRPAPSAAAMSPINRLIAYSAAAALRDLGYEWDEGTEEWKPTPTPQADSQPAKVWDYPPMPDFETVEQRIYAGCRRFVSRDMLEPIHGLIREAIDADRAARAPADSVLEDAALLDFIAQHPEMNLRHRKGKWAFVGFTNYEYEMLPSLREAIRAARKEGGAT